MDLAFALPGARQQDTTLSKAFEIPQPIAAASVVGGAAASDNHGILRPSFLALALSALGLRVVGRHRRTARRSARTEQAVTANKNYRSDLIPNKSVFGEMTGLARSLGKDCVDLGQGFPNYDPPAFVMDALREVLDTENATSNMRHQYTRTAGHPPFVEKLAQVYGTRLGRPLDPMKNIAVSTGATGALFLGLQTALARASPEAREIVALEPFFELYRSQVRGLNATLRPVPLRFDETENVFALDAGALESAITKKTAAIILNTPQNPTGAVLTRKELEAVAKIVKQNPHVMVISDEVYMHMIYDEPAPKPGDDPNAPPGHIHFAALPGMWDQTVTVSSCGKTFGVTGWQVGWAIGPEKMLAQMQSYIPNLHFCAPTLMQIALCKVFDKATQPYEGYQTYYDWMRASYKSKRGMLVSALESAGIPSVRTDGGFFLIADVGAILGPDGPLGAHWKAAERADEPQDWAFSRALAASLGIVSLPVSPFCGIDHPFRTRFVRFCYAKTEATMKEAAVRLKRLRK